jgi:hypothetical protein
MGRRVPASVSSMGRWRRIERSKQFFFEKKNQKTFMILAYAAGENRDSDIKVFCFFSSEKKAFLQITPARRRS